MICDLKQLPWNYDGDPLHSLCCLLAYIDKYILCAKYAHVLLYRKKKNTPLVSKNNFKLIKLFKNTHVFETNISERALLCPQRLAVGGVLVLGVSRSES